MRRIDYGDAHSALLHLRQGGKKMMASRQALSRIKRVRVAGIALIAISLLSVPQPTVRGEVGDPQLMSDDLWYPGELSCSTFDRLFKTEAALYERTTGKPVITEEDKALASWYWRNTHYWHGEEGQRDCFTMGFRGDKNRDYWTGLFADGFALCGTTHAQWCAEMDALLGHCRARVVGVNGHNSFEIYLTGGAYGNGRWALLDHDISTVIYTRDGARLMSLDEIVGDVNHLADPNFQPQRQHGWRVAGLYDDDARGVYRSVKTAEYLAGYAGPPPIVHLRSGESLRRYLQPGLDDGKTFVYWGANHQSGDIPGPNRDRTWVNQPDKMYGSKNGTGSHGGLARYANAVYTYTPNFADGSYKQGVIDESAHQVTFEFYTPYVIATTPPNSGTWGIYDAGGGNGLLISGNANCTVEISTDQGKSWQNAGKLARQLDLTDQAKGFQQYLLRFGSSAASLKEARLSWTTVCQANAATIPHLHDGENTITYLAGGHGLLAAGPMKEQAEAHLVEGKMGSKAATLELTAPRGALPVAVAAASWQASGVPPTDASYQIDDSTDGGATWDPIVKDWKIERRKPEPPDFWSQSFTWGQAELKHAEPGKSVRIRFSNDGGRTYRKVEGYLLYAVKDFGPLDVTFAWKEADGAVKTDSHSYRSETGREDATWRLNAGAKVQTLWVEMKAR